MGFLHGVRAYALEEWVTVGNPRLIDHVPGGQTCSIPRLISGFRVVGSARWEVALLVVLVIVSVGVGIGIVSGFYG
jgi:hypothetical protein